MSIELEAVERAEIEALHAAATGDLRETLGLRRETIGTALVSLVAAAPPSAIVLNRAIGLGVEAPASRRVVDAIVDRYVAAGVSRYFIHVHPDAVPSELRSWLLERGLEQALAWRAAVERRAHCSGTGSTMHSVLVAGCWPRPRDRLCLATHNTPTATSSR